MSNLHVALAEAGIIRSKLSDGNHGSNLNGDKELSYFSPERYLITLQTSWPACPLCSSIVLIVTNTLSFAVIGSYLARIWLLG